MAYKVNSLSDGVTTHSFIALTGPIYLAKNSVHIIARPNVSGIDTMIFPVKGVPFQLMSVSSLASETLAMTKYKAYCDDFIDAGLLTLIRADVNYFTSYTQKAKVLDVQLLEVQVTGRLVGNVSGSDTHLMSCMWHLAMEVAS